MKKLLSWLILCLLLWGFSSAIADTSVQDVKQYYLDAFAEKGIPVIDSPGINISLPAYIAPDPSQTNMNVSYRISTLPAKYQDKDEYYIFPKAWTVVPIVNFSPTDWSVVRQWLSVDHFEYLERGALHHRGNKPYNEGWNFTIAGHTSFEEDLPGDFKTNMQGIMLANPGDIMLYAHRIADDAFEVYRYRTYKSYETDPSNVSILLTDPAVWDEITIYGCSPIGTTDKRWVVKAKLIGTSEQSKTISIDDSGNAAMQDNTDSSVQEHGSPDEIPVDKKEEIKEVNERKETIVNNEPISKSVADTSIDSIVENISLRDENDFNRVVRFLALLVEAEKSAIFSTEKKEILTLLKASLFYKITIHIYKNPFTRISLQSLTHVLASL